MDFSALTTLVPPASAPIALDTVKAHCRITHSEEDALLADYLAAAVDNVESVLRRALVARRLKLTLPEFPADAPLFLPRSPVLAVHSIKYRDAAGALQSFTNYTFDRNQDPATVGPAVGYSWPSASAGNIAWRQGAVEVEYTAGYLNPFVVDTALDTITPQAQAYSDGDAVRLYAVGGTLPAPLKLGTTYYVRDSGASTLKLASSSGGAALDITSTGSGTLLMEGQPHMPATVLPAINLMFADMYEYRETVIVGTITARIEAVITRLLQPYRLFEFY